MVEPLDLQVNLAQTSEVGRMQQQGIVQTTALHQQLATKLELQAENAQTSVQTTQPSEEQQIEERKNNKNPFWWKRQRQKKEMDNIYTIGESIPHPIKGRIIDVWR